MWATFKGGARGHSGVKGSSEQWIGKNDMEVGGREQGRRGRMCRDS